MNLTNREDAATSAKYTIVATSDELAAIKKHVLKDSRKTVKVPGFRPGKAPDEMIEKQLDPTQFQNDFLNHAINDLYMASNDELKLRIVSEPQISVTKFVPFSVLEFSVSVPVITKVSLADYRKFDIHLERLPVTKEQLDTTMNELRRRGAKYEEVARATKLDDQVLIDFKGSDFKTKEELAQATGQDYALVLGSKNFVPGFEEKLVGLKSGQKTEFSLTFPKDYPDLGFRSRKVNFAVTVREVRSVDLPKLDDKFAASIGPFKSFKELEAEIRRQLVVENESQANRQFEDNILNKLAETTKVDIPEALTESESAKLEADAKQGALQRGQSWPEFLSSIGTDELGYKKQLLPLAQMRIRGGLAIGEIASKVGLEVTNNELSSTIAELKNQYTDQQMQAELDNPDNRRDILMRLLSEKVLEYIKSSLQSKPKATQK